MAIAAAPANVHDTKGIVPVLHQLAGHGFQGPAIGDLHYCGERLAKAAEGLGITVEPIARGRGGDGLGSITATVIVRLLGRQFWTKFWVE